MATSSIKVINRKQSFEIVHCVGKWKDGETKKRQAMEEAREAPPRIVLSAKATDKRDRKRAAAKGEWGRGGGEVMADGRPER